MSDSYSKIVHGGLKLKGGLSLKKKKKKKKKAGKKKKSGEGDDESESAAAAATQASGKKRKREDNGNEEPEIKVSRSKGKGRILSSGAVVTGQGTSFMSQIKSGDVITIKNPTTFEKEARLVKMVLSDSAISLDKGFSSSLISGTVFEIVRAMSSENDKDGEKQKAAANSLLKQEQQTVIVREKLGGAFGGYRLVKRKVDASMSREAMLDMRAKKKSDRFCN